MHGSCLCVLFLPFCHRRIQNSTSSLNASSREQAELPTQTPTEKLTAALRLLDSTTGNENVYVARKLISETLALLPRTLKATASTGDLRSLSGHVVVLGDITLAPHIVAPLRAAYLDKPTPVVVMDESEDDLNAARARMKSFAEVHFVKGSAKRRCAGGRASP